MRVTFKHFDAPEQEEQAREAFECVRSVLPFWVSNVSVERLDSEDNQSSSAIWCSPEYREVTIGIYARFYEADKSERLRTMLHECIHAFSSPLVDWIRVVIDEQMKDNVLAHKILTDELRERSESMTEDLTHAFANALGLE